MLQTRVERQGQEKNAENIRVPVAPEEQHNRLNQLTYTAVGQSLTRRARRILIPRRARRNGTAMTSLGDQFEVTPTSKTQNRNFARMV
jgi:hypothetical protein